MRRTRLSASEARRLALAAQGLDRSRPSSTRDIRHIRRALGSTGLLQLDFVNVLMPAHFLVLWSRLGPFDRQHAERFIYGSREYTEQWAHEASIVPVDCWPLLEYRRRSYQMHNYNPLRKLRNRKAYLESVLDQVQRDGALTSRELPPVMGRRRRPGEWHRSIPRWALEYHFARGDLVVSHRLPNFQRVFDLPERVLPTKQLNTTVSEADAKKELLRYAARSLGVATLHDLADYYRMSPRDAAPLVHELVEDGMLKPVAVEGWDAQGYLSRDGRLPREVKGASLLSPFDPIVWFRPRAERLFDFHYRIEIYVPATKRRWGYYVLPFRLGERIVARVDLKADRQAGTLRVLRSHLEPLAEAGETAVRLASELQDLQRWLELDAVNVVRHNGFSRQLAKAI
jgi:uncharacterized protein YcaQ